MTDKMIVSVSTQLPQSRLSANEIMQRVHGMIQAVIVCNPIKHPRPDELEQLITDWIELKREVYGESDE